MKLILFAACCKSCSAVEGYFACNDASITEVHDKAKQIGRAAELREKNAGTIDTQA
jgi:hypothetical protein